MVVANPQSMVTGGLLIVLCFLCGAVVCNTGGGDNNDAGATEHMFAQRAENAPVSTTFRQVLSAVGRSLSGLGHSETGQKKKKATGDAGPADENYIQPPNETVTTGSKYYNFFSKDSVDAFRSWDATTGDYFCCWSLSDTQLTDLNTYVETTLELKDHPTITGKNQCNNGLTKTQFDDWLGNHTTADAESWQPTTLAQFTNNCRGPDNAGVPGYCTVKRGADGNPGQRRTQLVETSYKAMNDTPIGGGKASNQEFCASQPGQSQCADRTFFRAEDEELKAANNNIAVERVLQCEWIPMVQGTLQPGDSGYEQPELPGTWGYEYKEPEEVDNLTQKILPGLFAALFGAWALANTFLPSFPGVGDRFKNMFQSHGSGFMGALHRMARFAAATIGLSFMAVFALQNDMAGLEHFSATSISNFFHGFHVSRNKDDPSLLRGGGVVGPNAISAVTMCFSAVAAIAGYFLKNVYSPPDDGAEGSFYDTHIHNALPWGLLAMGLVAVAASPIFVGSSAVLAAATILPLTLAALPILISVGKSCFSGAKQLGEDYQRGRASRS